MYKLNFLLYPNVQDFHICKANSLEAINNNEEFFALKDEFLKKYNFKNIKTLEFSKYGILGLLLELDGNIAISLGETQAIIDGAIEYEKLGYKITWLELNKNGSLNSQKLHNEEFDYIFISSYIMDTFVKVDLEEIKKYTNAKIISNATAHLSMFSDIIFFDTYKLSGYGSSCVILYNYEFNESYLANIDALSIYFCFEILKNQEFSTTNKNIFKKKLEDIFKENLYYFVDNSNTLEYTYHLGLKGIKARELIRALALNNTFITNGEGCSLGASKPSRVIQAMGYSEEISRNSISLSFCCTYSEIEIEKIVKQIYRKYKEIKALNE